MEEGRKRVLGIIAGILVARHLKTTEDLHDSRPSPRTESLVGSAVQWAERDGFQPMEIESALQEVELGGHCFS